MYYVTIFNKTKIIPPNIFRFLMMDYIVVDEIEKDTMLKRLDYLLEMIYAEFLLSKSFKGDNIENIHQ